MPCWIQALAEYKGPLPHFPDSQNTAELSTIVLELAPMCSGHTEGTTEDRVKMHIVYL